MKKKKTLSFLITGLLLFLILTVKGENIAAGGLDNSASLTAAAKPKSVSFKKFTYGKNYVKLSWQPVECINSVIDIIIDTHHRLKTCGVYFFNKTLFSGLQHIYLQAQNALPVFVNDKYGNNI